MTGPTNSPLIIVDDRGRRVADPSRVSVGSDDPLGRGARLVWALPLNGSQGGLSLRYHPDHPPTERCNFGMDFSFAVPFGVGIASGSLSIFTNLANPVAADADWQKGPVVVRGRQIYAMLSGGVPGTDYQLRWTALDDDGNTWPRTAMALCAQTS